MHFLKSPDNFSSIESLYFLHIPKTGGSSIKYWLGDMFSINHWMPHEILESIDELPINEFQKYRYFCGHFGLKLYDYLDKVPTTVTWLRQPLLREISDYFYKKEYYDYLTKIANNYNSEWIRYYELINSMSISELCQSDIFLGYSDNLQVRYLSGTFPQSEKVECNSSMLNAAKNNLEKIFYFGICEWMELSIDFLSYYLKLPEKPLQLRYNSGKMSAKERMRTLKPKEIDIITNANYYDLKLYHFAQELLLKRWNEFYHKKTGERVEGLTKNLNNNYKFSETRSRMLSILKQNFRTQNILSSKQRYINFSCADSALLSGWYPCFFYAEKGVWLRWAGPDTTSKIYFPLESGMAYKIRLKIPFVMALDIIESLHLRINEQVISLQKNSINSIHSPDGIDFLLEGYIPSDIIKSEDSYTEICFHVNRTILQKIRSDNNSFEDCYTSFTIEKIVIEALV